MERLVELSHGVAWRGNGSESVVPRAAPQPTPKRERARWGKAAEATADSPQLVGKTDQWRHQRLVSRSRACAIELVAVPCQTVKEDRVPASTIVSCLNNRKM